MRLLRARADEFASLVDMNTRVLVAATQLIGQVQGQGVDAGMQELGTLLGGMQGVNFWIAERDGASGTATRSIGPASELAPLLTASQWGDLFAATSERPVLPTVRSTAPDGSILLGFATRLSDGRAAVLECNIREIADGVAGNDPGLEAALYFGPVAAAPLVIASTTHSGTVTEPSVSQVIRVNGGLPATLVVGGRVGASPSWLINAILLAGILIGLAAAAAVTALQDHAVQVAGVHVVVVRGIGQRAVQHLQHRFAGVLRRELQHRLRLIGGQSADEVDHSAGLHRRDAYSARLCPGFHHVLLASPRLSAGAPYGRP